MTQSSCEGTPSGYVATSTDCNDSSTSVYLGATEIVADGIDQDCDAVDSCYTDADGDNYGTTVVTDGSSLSCVTGTGAAVSTDCVDTSSSIHPGASEVCDAADADEDCDGTTEDADASVSGQTTFYADVDGDGYGSDTAVLSCEPPSGYVSDTTDCDDTSAAISPADTEICDSANTDEDCDGLADDDDSSVTGATTYSRDADGDGQGGTTTLSSCEGTPSGYVATSTDCNDSSATVYLGATEVVADGIDQDCDTVDSCYTDADGDTYGTTVVTDGSSLSCATGTGAANASDCDDTSATIHPGATEVVGDGIDQTCDGAESCYVDADGDGARTVYTVASPDAACTGSGEALGTADLDCDDGDADAYPGATEIVGDGVDEDCDGAEDCYVDADDDSYRPDTTSTVASGDADCSDLGEALASALTGDCDDADAAFHPFASESDCSDANDYNCDGSTGYIDADGDGSAACEECDDADATVHPGATEVPGDGDRYAACEDCDDTDATVRPGAVEAVGDGVDQDCDQLEDCYVDADDDGYRPDATSTVSTATVTCTGSGEAFVTDPIDDCDDADATVNPGATEVVADGIDEDCDGDELCWLDADNDGYTADEPSTIVSPDLTCESTGEADADAPAGDCDDTDDDFNPGAAETDCLDPADYNCDGSSGSIDGDADGFAACEECDDGVASINPDADEICNDLDDDCDGTIDVDAVDATTWYVDADGDGYTDPDASVVECDAPDGYTAATEDDCDDDDAAINPDGDDVPGDAIDQDCDGADAVAEGDDTGDTGGTPKDDGCGCATSDPLGLSALILATLVLVRRRRRTSTVLIRRRPWRPFSLGAGHEG